MSDESADLIRTAFAAYERGDMAAMLEFVAPNLEWTYRDPQLEDPEPQVCHGRRELEIALARRAEHGLTTELQEVLGNGDRVMVVARAKGLDAHRVRKADDRNFSVFTVRGGLIVALRDCRDRQEAMAAAGLD